MKVILHYEDNDNTELHKSLKITLPKSWKTGPTSKLLAQFVETYNETFVAANRLQENELHLVLRQSTGDEKTRLVALASDAVVLEVVPDRADVYVMHGASQTLDEMKTDEEREVERKRAEKLNTVACTHFGCKNRFPPGGPYPECHYHSAPPVFHETAKFWSCCPNKKAYDWDDFQNIPGCQTGTCTEVKESQKQFLGGTDLREKVGESVRLKSIDDFNKAQAAGGSDSAPVLERLRNVLAELGLEKELFDQVVDGMRKDLVGSEMVMEEADILGGIAKELGNKLKAAMKSIAVEQLRIK